MKQRIVLTNARSEGLLWRISITIILLIGIIYQAKAQDSLYLVGTITGESYDKRITDVKGIGDVNGDGFDDFMVASYVSNTVTLYLGSSGLDLIKDVTFKPHSSMKQVVNFGGISGIGDVNADGYDDFIIHAAFRDYVLGKGIVFLYYGGIEVDTVPVNEFYEDWNQDGFGSFTTGIGDLNKDGYDDFVVGSYYNWDNGKGYAYLFWGGDTISWNRSLTFVSPNPLTGDFFGRSAANIGDINNDGYDDLAIGAPNQAFPDSGKVYIYYGGNPMDTISDAILVSDRDTYEFGRIIKNVGDINGDGVNHFFVNSDDYIFLFTGTNRNVFINGSDLGFGGYLNIEAGFDINKDRINDFIIGNTNYLNSDSIWVGGSFLFLGNEILDTIYNYKLEGETRGSEFSKVISHGDINGDGYDELFILSPSYPDFDKPQGKIYIYSYKKITEVKDYKGNYPNNFKLYQNYPNPFNPTTIISYEIPTRGLVTVIIYDVLGKKITTLVNEEKTPGEYKVRFDGSDLASGIYFCQLIVDSFGKAGSVILTNKLMLLK